MNTKLREIFSTVLVEFEARVKEIDTLIKNATADNLKEPLNRVWQLRGTYITETVNRVKETDDNAARVVESILRHVSDGVYNVEEALRQNEDPKKIKRLWSTYCANKHPRFIRMFKHNIETCEQK